MIAQNKICDVSTTPLSMTDSPTRAAYPSDLSDAEWDVIQLFLPQPKGFGRPPSVDLREILNAIFYIQRTGCQWEMLPHDFPPYSTVYRYFRKWQCNGIWQQMHNQIRHRLRTLLMNREADSGVAIADSRLVKTTETGF